MPPPSEYNVRRTAQSRAWSVTSYGDFAEFAGVGAGLWHFRFRNDANGYAENFVLVAGGVGLEAELPAGWLTTVGQRAVNVFNNFVSRGVNLSTASYTRCVVPHAISFERIDASRGMISSAQAGIAIDGYSLFGLNVCEARTGTAPLMSANLSGRSSTLGAGLFAAGGVLVSVEMPAHFVPSGVGVSEL